MKKLKKLENIRRAFQERIARLSKGVSTPSTPPPAATTKAVETKPEPSNGRRQTKVAVA